MRYAILNRGRIEATPGARGICPGCGSELIARCGTQKVWHWAHKGQRHCDHWWDPETEWHRAWKDRFPKDWQEVPARDAHGELHIADVKTPRGMVVEFQHSPISATERFAREEFYRDMVWVVDGTRSKRDHSTFVRHIASKIEYQKRNQNVEFNPLVPQITRRWGGGNSPVYLDFGSDGLWRISIEMKGIWQKHASRVDRAEFVEIILGQSDFQEF